GLVRICLGDLELGDDVGVRPPQTTIELGPALRYRIGNVELAVLAVVRVEGEPEQTALIEEVVEDDDPRLHVKKRLGQQTSLIVDDADVPVLLNQRHAAGAVRNRY